MAEKLKFEKEYLFRSSISILYSHISTETGLSEWFSEKVIQNKKKFTFSWGGSEETATLIDKKDKVFVRFKWDEDEEKDTFFELRIRIDDLTNEVALVVTDFSEAEEQEEAILLWDSLIDELKHVVGS